MIPPVLPETAVSLAWGLTTGYSSLPEAQVTAQEIKDRVTKIRKEQEARPATDPLREKHLQYADATFSLVDSTLRNLAVIIQGRNNNFREVDELMNTQIEKIKSIDRVTADAQSALPRIFATGGGLSAPLVLLQFLGIALPPAVVAALGVITGGIAYGLYQLFFVPSIKGRT